MIIAITRPAFLDQDQMLTYRTTEASRDSRGNYASGGGSGYTLVSATPTMVNHHGTHNFDERIGGRGVPAILKKQNIMTSDVIDCDISADVRPEDVVKITIRTTGKVIWLTVVGVADDRPLTGYTTFYGTPTPAVA